MPPRCRRRACWPCCRRESTKTRMQRAENSSAAPREQTQIVWMLDRKRGCAIPRWRSRGQQAPATTSERRWSGKGPGVFFEGQGETPTASLDPDARRPEAEQQAASGPHAAPCEQQKVFLQDDE